MMYLPNTAWPNEGPTRIWIDDGPTVAGSRALLKSNSRMRFSGTLSSPACTKFTRIMPDGTLVPPPPPPPHPVAADPAATATAAYRAVSDRATRGRFEDFMGGSVACQKRVGARLQGASGNPD